MLSLAHSATGAFIATQVANPFIAVPLIFFSHYLEDWIPHWDVGTGLSNGSRKKSTAIILELGDLVLTAGLIYWFWQLGSEQIVWAAWWGALVGLVPDFMEAPRNFFNWEPFFLKPFNEVHGWFHHSVPYPFFGLISQVLVLVVIYFLR